MEGVVLSLALALLSRCELCKDAQLRCCPLEAGICMAVHGAIQLSPPNRCGAWTLTPLASSLVRSHGADGHHPTIRREEEFDDDRLSGEYYSGEEFYEDDSMLSGDRYYSSCSSSCVLLVLRTKQ